MHSTLSPLNCALQGEHLVTSVTPFPTVQPWRHRHHDAITKPEAFRKILEHGPQSDTLPKHQTSHSDVSLRYNDSVDDKQ